MSSKPICEKKSCKKVAKFGFNKPRRCFKHKKKGMTNVNIPIKPQSEYDKYIAKLCKNNPYIRFNEHNEMYEEW